MESRAVNNAVEEPSHQIISLVASGDQHLGMVAPTPIQGTVRYGKHLPQKTTRTSLCSEIKIANNSHFFAKDPSIEPINT
jgi:hypothetical protein